MDQPPALRHPAATARASGAARHADVWESDLADLAALPLTAVDGLVPLHPNARLLKEVLRARSSMRAGGEGGSGGARAE
ncbi:hypothetical protein OG252_14655 [Streptomyces sp. NBC_01352]|uniref:Uncharacterized protein n=1 Tax=Streptomyces plumbiresistens TaxID=511811 RepID=A0ABP7SNX6_9ACTN|nr:MULTISPECIES: hypothetical protein [unclassified Streptomyces]MCX4697296.1 hypothetical protein [Streptomyces sp. NBC_01373]